MMKRILFSAAFLSLLVASPAHAQDPVLDMRRTLYISFGQENVILEAPKDMCFLDDNIPAQGNFLTYVKDIEAKKGKGVLMAVFADCMQISQLGQAGGPPLPDMGIVRWMNPMIGETTDIAQSDYLDMREGSLEATTQENFDHLQNIEIDPAHRTDNGIMNVFTGTSEIEAQRYTTTGILAAILIQNIPVDISITRTSASRIPKNKAELLALMEKLVAQQVILNTH